METTYAPVDPVICHKFWGFLSLLPKTYPEGYYLPWLNCRIPRHFGPPHLHVSGRFKDRGITQ